MHVITFSQARAGFKQAMDDVCRDHEPAVIIRQRGVSRSSCSLWTTKTR